MRSKSYRRHQSLRYKKKVKKLLKEIFSFSPEELGNSGLIGKYYQNRKPCSCFMCGNPRKYYKEQTRQETLAILNDKELMGAIERSKLQKSSTIPWEEAKKELGV